VNATERTALLQSAALRDELVSAVDERTLEILERRRKTAIVRRRGWLVRRALVAADLLGLIAAFGIAQALFGASSAPVDRVGPDTEWALFMLTLPAWVVVGKLYGLYDRDEERTDHSTADDVVGVFHLVTVCAWLLFAVTWLTGVANPSIAKVMTFWALATVLVPVGRAAARGLCRRSLTYLQNTIIVGAGEVGQTIARKLLQHPEYGINLVGFVDDAPKERREDLGHLTLLGGSERLPGLIRVFDVERVIIAFSNDSHEQTLGLIRSVKDLDVQVDIVPRLYELVGPNVGFHSVEGVPLLGLPPLSLTRSSRLLKRSMDVFLSSVGLILLAPVFLAIALAIKVESRGPVFFRQVRMGRDGTFRIWKFRTMWADADARKSEFAHLNKHLQHGGDPRMFKIADDPRTTRVGRFLRSHLLDELPQLVNVLAGQMSLVGPRPLILDEDQFVDEWWRQRLNLKPGCTGPWQVFGRDGIPFEEMLRLDLIYVTTWSMWNDARLLLRTIPLLTRGGAGR
jgi:exopolysaccharide biosynthesis polyprenyl glycosylphosphotransferase